MSHDDDPVAHASTKVMAWASLASTAAEAFAQIAASRARERAERSMWVVSVERARRHARFARDRLWFEAVTNPERYVVSDVRDAGLAWAAAHGWKGTPEADHAAACALSRLRELRPDVMRLYDFFTVDEGLDPVLAMRRVAPLMDRPPAYPMRPERPELCVPTTSGEIAEQSYVESPPLVEQIPRDVERERLLSVCRDTERWWREQLDQSWVPEYLAARGLGSCVGLSSAWAVGYAPNGWSGLVDHLGAQGYSDADLLAAGVASRSSRGTLVDRFRDRLMVSVRDPAGETVGFVGRANPEARSQRVPKYLNSPETALYHKGALLLGLYEHRHQLAAGAIPVIVEGAFDAMAVDLATDGRWVGVAPSGTAVTAGQVEALSKMSSRPVVVMLDGDAAGRRAALHAFDVLSAAKVDTPVAAVLPDKADPASLWQSGAGAELLAVLERDPRPLADLVVDAKLAEYSDQLDRFEGRVSAMRATVPTVAGLPTRDVGRQVVRVAHRLGVDVETVSAEVLDHISKPPAETSVSAPRRPAAALSR